MALLTFHSTSSLWEWCPPRHPLQSVLNTAAPVRLRQVRWRPCSSQDSLPSLWWLRDDAGLDAYQRFLCEPPRCLRIPLWSDLHPLPDLISTTFLLLPHVAPWCSFPHAQLTSASEPLHVLCSKPRILSSPNIFKIYSLTSCRWVLKTLSQMPSLITLCKKWFSVTLLSPHTAVFFFTTHTIFAIYLFIDVTSASIFHERGITDEIESLGDINSLTHSENGATRPQPPVCLCCPCFLC